MLNGIRHQSPYKCHQARNVVYILFETTIKDHDTVKKNDVICEFDPFNSVIITEEDGTINFDAIEEGITFKTEVDEQTGFSEKIIIETKDKKKKS